MTTGTRYCAKCLHVDSLHDPTGCEACRTLADNPDHAFDSGQPRGFALIRHVDQTGVSGVGLVMQGVVFRDGRAPARWVTEGAPRSTVLWDTYEDWWEVHVAPPSPPRSALRRWSRPSPSLTLRRVHGPARLVVVVPLAVVEQHGRAAVRTPRRTARAPPTSAARRRNCCAQQAMHSRSRDMTVLETARDR